MTKEGYLELCYAHDNVVLLSQMKDDHNTDLNIHIPYTINSDYDDIVYILILDLIKYLYYKKIGLNK